MTFFKTQRCSVIVCTCCLDVIKHDLSQTEVLHTRCEDHFCILQFELMTSTEPKWVFWVGDFGFHPLSTFDQFLSYRLLLTNHLLVTHVFLCIYRQYSGSEAGPPNPLGKGGCPAAHRGADSTAAQHAVCGPASHRAGCRGKAFCGAYKYTDRA